MDPQVSETPAAKRTETLMDSEERWGSIMQINGTCDMESDQEDEGSSEITQVDGMTDAGQQEEVDWGELGSFFSTTSDEEEGDSTGPPPWLTLGSGRMSTGGETFNEMDTEDSYEDLL
jgi:hypothetical protein